MLPFAYRREEFLLHGDGNLLSRTLRRTSTTTPSCLMNFALIMTLEDSLVKQGMAYERVTQVMSRLLEVASPAVPQCRFAIVVREKAYQRRARRPGALKSRHRDLTINGQQGLSDAGPLQVRLIDRLHPAQTATRALLVILTGRDLRAVQRKISPVPVPTPAMRMKRRRRGLPGCRSSRPVRRHPAVGTFPVSDRDGGRWRGAERFRESVSLRARKCPRVVDEYAPCPIRTAAQDYGADTAGPQRLPAGIGCPDPP